MNLTLYLSFLATSLLILALPGPSLAYAVAVAARAPRRDILLNAAGMGFGGVCITLALALGVARLLAASPLAHAALQGLGCVYLIGLGVKTFFARVDHGAVPLPQQDHRGSALWSLLQGFLVETANPKAILFYVSLVPQFVDAARGDVQYQLLVLGASFVAMQVLWDLSLMLGVLRLRDGLSGLCMLRAKRIANRMCGVTFVGLGLALLFQVRPASR